MSSEFPRVVIHLHGLALILGKLLLQGIGDLWDEKLQLIFPVPGSYPECRSEASYWVVLASPGRWAQTDTH